ncbi:MAG: glycosyltransferase family 39 protein [Bacteroidetes bacterium]|nr:glycosyltransferase family 39 protein [Bacteroidota bacterium]
MVFKFIKEHTVFGLILLACIVLRFIPLFDYQFTLDELSGLDRTRFDSVGELIDKGVKIDAHPAFVQVLIWYLTKFFGYTNWIIKLPFLLFSFGAIVYAYFFCLKNFSKQVAIICALIFSFSLVFVFYASIARMYISGIFFSIALLYYFFNIFFLGEEKKRNYFFLGLFALLSALNQHVNALFAFTVCASGLFFLNKNNSKPYLIALAITIVAYLPHLPVTLYQLSIGGIGIGQGGWLPKPEITAVLEFLQIIFGTGRTYWVFLFLIMVCFVINKKIFFNKKQIFLVSVFCVNYLVVYFYSVFNSPIFQNSVMLFSGVAIVIFVSSLLDLQNKIVFNITALIILTVLIFKTYYKKDYFHQCVKTVFEYQYERTFEHKKNYGEENVYPVFFDSDEVMEGIYFKKYNNSFKYKGSQDSVTISVKHFSEFVATLKTDYLILSSAYPVFQLVALEYYPYLIENVETQAINYKLYSKRPEDKNKTVEGEAVIYSANYFDKKDLEFKNALPFQVDSMNEYPFGADVPLNKLTSKAGQVISLKATFKLSQKVNDLRACISINSTNKDIPQIFDGGSTGQFLMKPDSTITVYANSFCGTPYKKMKHNSKCGFFIWNAAKEKFVITDFEVQTIDFWPQKWNFWE